MAVMTQAEMKKLVQGGSIVDDSSMDVQQGYMSAIAIAALGDNREALRAVLKPYIEELAELATEACFFAPAHEQNAAEHIDWLRSL